MGPEAVQLLCAASGFGPRSYAVARPPYWTRRVSHTLSPTRASEVLDIGDDHHRLNAIERDGALV